MQHIAPAAAVHVCRTFGHLHVAHSLIAYHAIFSQHLTCTLLAWPGCTQNLSQGSRQISLSFWLIASAATVLSDVDWDSKLNGGQLCLYHKPKGDQGEACGDQDKACGDQGQACGEQATLVAPAGDTLVIFDSHMEHEVFPSFADRCPNLQTVSQHLHSLETSLAATSTLLALQLSRCTVIHRLSSRVSLSQNLHAADDTANLSHLIALIVAHPLWESTIPLTPSSCKLSS